MNSTTPSKLQTGAAGARNLRPTQMRWVMMGMLTIITALTYVDRLNLGIAGEYIQTEFHLSTHTMGWILGAFVLGYALFQVPGGWAGDRFGPRSILTFAIVWWSIFTALTAVAPELPLRAWLGVAGSFIVVRFLIGMGEAAAFPNSNKTISFWLGENARGVGNSIFLMGIGVGGTVTPIVIAWIMQTWGWRTSFYVCAVLGFLVAIIWHSIATSRPEDHPRVNAAELALIHPKTDKKPIGSRPGGAGPVRVPWKRLIWRRSTWCLMLSYFCEAYPNYIFFTWIHDPAGRILGCRTLPGCRDLGAAGRVALGPRHPEVRQAPRATVGRMAGYDAFRSVADDRGAHHKQLRGGSVDGRSPGLQHVRDPQLVGGVH
jgi:ACS family glucarate transporter-like MFS transporter